MTFAIGLVAGALGVAVLLLFLGQVFIACLVIRVDRRLCQLVDGIEGPEGDEGDDPDEAELEPAFLEEEPPPAPRHNWVC